MDGLGCKDGRRWLEHNEGREKLSVTMGATRYYLHGTARFWNRASLPSSSSSSLASPESKTPHINKCTGYERAHHNASGWSVWTGWNFLSTTSVFKCVLSASFCLSRMPKSYLVSLTRMRLEVLRRPGLQFVGGAYDGGKTAVVEKRSWFWAQVGG